MTNQNSLTPVANTLTLGTSAQVEIVSQGALLNAFWVEQGDQRLNLIKGFSHQYDVEENLLRSYNSARLSPFPNRIADGHYQFQGASYQLPINFPDGHAIHGLIANSHYHIQTQSDEQMNLTHQYVGDQEAFPFPFTSEVSYEFKDNQLTCSTLVTNTGTSDLPYAEGWHPYFTLGGRVNDWSLRFPSTAMLEVNERMIPTGKWRDYREFEEWKKINDTCFDTCFAFPTDAQRVSTALRNDDKKIQLEVFQEVGDQAYQYVQLFTPDDRQSLAIEPMTAIPDVLNNGIGLIQLAPTESVRLVWGIKVSNI